VFPMSSMVSLPPAIICAVMSYVHKHHDPIAEALDTDEVQQRIFLNNSVWSGFIFLVGFLTVFRTSHSYNRFWEACASVHKMGAEWFDSCSALIAYTKVSKADVVEVHNFQNRVVRLFSMLHAVALAELEDLDNGNEELEVRSFALELVDAGAFDDETLMAVRDSSCRVELVYQWIQSLVVEAQANGILSIPPPILTRSFQELSGGMVNFHDAMKVADTPFPFPYLQTCDILLFVLYISAPFVVSTYTNTFLLAGFFCFVLIFTFSCLTLTGLELEFPFGRDANDIQGADLQLEMNHKLKLLVSAASWRAPQMRRSAGEAPEKQHQALLIRNLTADTDASRSSFAMLWSSLPVHSERREDGQISPTASAELGEAQVQAEFSTTRSQTTGGGKRKRNKEPARRNAKMRSRRMKASPLTQSYLDRDSLESLPQAPTANSPSPTKAPVFKAGDPSQARSDASAADGVERVETHSEGVGLTV